MRAPQLTAEQGNLIVDDDDDIRETMVEVVQGTGRQVFTAKDGSDALEVLDRDDVPRPCLILLDWVMRPMSGGDFLVRLKARGDAAQLPVLIMSANTKVPPHSITPGVLGTLRKPFSYEALLAIIDEHC